LTTVADNKIQNTISTTARRAERNKIKPNKANFVTIMYETHKAVRLSTAQLTLLCRVQPQVSNSYKKVLHFPHTIEARTKIMYSVYI
jgi:hypothetical protein